VDVFGLPGEAVILYVSPNVRSVKAVHVNSFCATPPPANLSWINQGVKLELYTALDAGGVQIGAIFYGHLRDRLQEGVYNNPGGSGLVIGYLGTEDCPNSERCDCYPPVYPPPYSQHTHMTRSSDGITIYRPCGSSVDPTTPIYYWTGP